MNILGTPICFVKSSFTNYHATSLYISSQHLAPSSNIWKIRILNNSNQLLRHFSFAAVQWLLRGSVSALSRARQLQQRCAAGLPMRLTWFTDVCRNLFANRQRDGLLEAGMAAGRCLRTPRNTEFPICEQRPAKIKLPPFPFPFFQSTRSTN